jgi:hypothetical protein
MKKSLILIVLSFVICLPAYGQTPRADEQTIKLARVFSKDLFEYNGVAFAKTHTIL